MKILDYWEDFEGIQKCASCADQYYDEQLQIEVTEGELPLCMRCGEPLDMNWRPGL